MPWVSSNFFYLKGAALLSCWPFACLQQTSLRSSDGLVLLGATRRRVFHLESEPGNNNLPFSMLNDFWWLHWHLVFRGLVTLSEKTSNGPLAVRMWPLGFFAAASLVCSGHSARGLRACGLLALSRCAGGGTEREVHWMKGPILELQHVNMKKTAWFAYFHLWNAQTACAHEQTKPPNQDVKTPCAI